MLLGPDDKQRFNDFVAACDYGDFMQAWEWGELKARTGWQAFRLALEDDGRIAAAVQLLKRSVPGLNRCLLYSPRGPLYDLDRPQLFDGLMAEIDALARQHGAMAYKMDPAVEADDKAYVAALGSHDFRPSPVADLAFGGTQPRYVMRVDVTPPEETIMAGFKSKWRYNVRLAERKGVEVIGDCPRESVEPFYHLLLETAERDRFKVRAKAYFYDIYDLFISCGMGSLFVAAVESEPVAGAITLAVGERAWYVYGASSNRHREKMPNHLLQWRMMCWAKQRGCRIYDMRGVAHQDNTESPLYGLNRFKEGFGARYVEYVGEWDRVYAPTWYRLFGLAEPVARKLRLLAARFRG